MSFGKIFNLLKPQFLICKVGIVIIYLTELLS